MTIKKRFEGWRAVGVQRYLLLKPPLGAAPSPFYG